MVDSRNICTLCIDKGFSNTFELCDDCIDKPISRDSDGIIHERSHAIVKVRTTLPPGSLAWMLPKARLLARHVKSSFAVANTDPNTSADLDLERRCLIGECEVKTAVGYPFWVCLQCSSGYPRNLTLWRTIDNNSLEPEQFQDQIGYVCEPCAQKEYQPHPNDENVPEKPYWWEHGAHHHLVRITDSSVPDEAMDTDKKLVALERKFQELDKKQDERIGSVDKRLASVDERLAKLEDMLTQLLAQTKPGLS